MKTGYLLNIGKKEVFLESTSETKSKNTVLKMIESVGKYRGLCDDMIKRCQGDEYTYKRIQREMARVTLEEKETNGEKWYSIRGKYFGGGYDIDEIVIF